MWSSFSAARMASSLLIFAFSASTSSIASEVGCPPPCVALAPLPAHRFCLQSSCKNIEAALAKAGSWASSKRKTGPFLRVVPRLKQHDTSNGLSYILGTSLGLRQGVPRGRVARIVSSPKVVVHDNFDVVHAFPTIEGQAHCFFSAVSKAFAAHRVCSVNLARWMMPTVSAWISRIALIGRTPMISYK